METEVKKMFVVSMAFVSGGETLAERRLAQFFNFSDAFKYAEDAQKTISNNEDSRFFTIEIEAFEIAEYKNDNVQGVFDMLNK